MTTLLSPLARALGQLDDPVFLGVLLRSLLWAAGCFIALHAVAIWAVHHLLDLQGWLGWAADIAGGVGASFLALWLFLPVAVIIGTLYIDRIAQAVERRHYPALPPARGAPIAAQLWDAISIAARILLLNVLALVAALVLPGVGLMLRVAHRRLCHRSRPVRRGGDAPHATAGGRGAVSPRPPGGSGAGLHAGAGRLRADP